MRSVSIKLERNEQLTPDFLDLFSKMIINNTDFIFGEYINQQPQMKYRQFHDYLTKCSQLRHSGIKSPISRWNRVLKFNFQAKNNNIVYLLDLSPYMLIYNFGTNSFPIKNMQEIVVYLLRRLTERLRRDPMVEYKISIYMYSIYCKKLESIVLNELINEQNFGLLCELVNKSIQKTRLPHQKSTRKQSLSDIIQQLFNKEETNLGMKSIVVISAFHEYQPGPLLLFTPNWSTFGFVNTGGHFGSYKIENEQIESKLMLGSYFNTKFVFDTLFLENWEMTQHIKQKQPQKPRTIIQKYRSILFQYKGKRYQDIYDFLLNFQIMFQDIKKSKVVSGGQSVMSSIKDNPNKLIHKTYKIPADSFIYILRTKYVQGWEPVLLNFTSLVQNSKFKLRLHLSNNNYMFYQANRSQNNFIITIYQYNQNGFNIQKDLTNNDKIELTNMIEKMDKINSYNFFNLLNRNFKLRESKSNTKNSLIFFHSLEYEIMNDLCQNIGEWGKYFKIKRICFRFTPFLNAVFLQEFLNEISFILGKKLSKFIFIKQSQSQKRSQKADQIQSSNRRVMFTRINLYGNIIQLQLAFLRFIYTEIMSTLDSLVNKLHNRKFKRGLIDRVPNRIVDFFKDSSIMNHPLFHRKWIIKMKNKYYKNLFIIYWEQILKKTGYEQFTTKNNQSSQKNYYKLLEVRTENNGIAEKVAFLKVKESHQKDTEIMFQIAIPPCLATLYPFYRDIQPQSKKINVGELSNILALQLKKNQQQIIKLIDTYQTIHLKLLKATSYCPPKLLNYSLQQLNLQLYDIKPPFRILFSSHCKQIVNKYYRQYKQTINLVPTPSKFLMNIQLDHIEGDINLKIDGKDYPFFICSPYKFIYLYYKDNNIYYKIVNLYYQEYNAKENQNFFLDTVLKETSYNINEQIYCKNFETFLRGNFKGGIAKIINNQQFTHVEQRKIHLLDLLTLIQRFNPSGTLKPGSVQYNRLKKTTQTFVKKLFLLIHEFFPLLRVNYYFQVRKERDTPPPFHIDTTISRLDTELFMRATFCNNSDQTGIDITPQNVTELIINNFAEIMKNNGFLVFRYYLKIRNTSEKNEFCSLLIDYFTTLIKQLIFDVSFQIQRTFLTLRELKNDYLSFMTSDPKKQIVKLQLIKEEQIENAEYLCKYIESNVMQYYLRFKRIKQQPNQFVVIEEVDDITVIKFTILLRVISGSLMEFVYKPAIFYEKQQSEGKDQLHLYLQKLRNYINASKLMKQLTETYELPLQPYELYLNQCVNHPNNKIIAVKKKKVTKNPAIKYMRKAAIFQQTPNSNQVNVNTMPSNKLVPLPLIYRNFLPLNERIDYNQSLQALKQDQIFKLGQIHNLKNTYLFLNFCQKNHIIFHFQQKDDEQLIREISQQNKWASFHKCKKYLLYYVFCLNPLVSKQSIQKIIYPPLKKAINRKLFDEVSNYLLNHSSIIQEDDQYFIKGSGGMKKESKQYQFQLPNHFFKEQFVGYLIQHIEVYHYRIFFKSQLQTERPKSQAPQNKFFQSIRVLQPANIQNTKIFIQYVKDLTLSKRSVSSSQVIDNFSASTTFERSKQSDLSFFKGIETISMVKSGDYFSYDVLNHHYQYLNYTWLFNYLKQEMNLAEKYGKCLYILKVKLKQENNRQASDCEAFISDKSSYLFMTTHEGLQLSQMKKQMLKKHSSKLIKRESVFRSSIVFEVTDHQGIIKLQQIGDAFSFITKAVLGQYYLENYLYLQYKLMVKSIYSLKSQQRQYSQAEFKQKQKQLCNNILQNIVNLKSQVDCLLQQLMSWLFFKYRSSNLLIKDIRVYFIGFINEFIIILKDIIKTQDVKNLHIVIYCDLSDDKTIYEEISLGQIPSFKEKLDSFPIQTCSKLGFILTDYKEEISSVISGILKKPQAKQSPYKPYQELKNFKSPRGGQGIQDHIFRRSLYAYFEINYQSFIYGSYNILPLIDKEVREYLNALDCWLFQKWKLLKFIKNIKQNNLYEVSLKTTQQQKNISAFIYEMRYPQQPMQKVQVSDSKHTLNMYRLLVNLTLVDYPQRIAKRDSQAVGKESKIIRPKLIHHCTQIQELFLNLQKHHIDYGLYGGYKGNQKFLLDRLGRQYISILREQFRSY